MTIMLLAAGLFLLPLIFAYLGAGLLAVSLDAAHAFDAPSGWIGIRYSFGGRSQ